MLSILYSDGHSEIPRADNKLAEDLLLDETFAGFCPDVPKRQIFLSVLTNPLTDTDEILFRRAVLRDITASPNLCGALRTELDGLVKLRDEAQKERSRAYTTSRSTDSDAAFSNAKTIAMIYADTAVKVMSSLSGLLTVLNMYGICSEGFLKVKKRAADFISQSGTEFDSEAFCDCCQKIADYGYSGEFAEISMRFRLNSDGRIVFCGLNEISSVEPAEKPTGLKALFARKSESSAKAEQSREIAVHDPYGKLKNSLFTAAAARESELIDHMLRDIFDEFCPLARELAFYETAQAFIKVMKEKRVPFCIPEFSDFTEISELYDAELISKFPNVSCVVPNDVFISRAGIIITGENSSGKTVYLRSTGTAQLLFQAGLPVLAKSAKMKPRCAVYTRFAASEKEFCSGNDAGRFEQEVREIAPLVDSIKPGSLLLLNEIFQTTSYSEGAEGLYSLLCYFMRRGSDFIAVTHLSGLLGKFRGANSGVTHIETVGGYKVRAVNDI